MLINKIRNKRGWIRIVEAFVAILIVAGIVLIVIGRDQTQREDVSSDIYSSMIAILREIQLDNSLRADIITTSGTVEWDSGNFPANVKNKIIAKAPGYLECVGKICATNDVCLLTQNQENQEKTIYAETAIISSTIQSYNPRLLKLFCWTK
ncbi:MAG TPA: hypothetical protein VJ142_02255 [Candidatus Nanoarchaeia archaeon]|nr:hypothetical protein [Candidatus Nanoarchaeia archaeon]